MYKDKEKQRVANKESAKKYRLKGMTPIEAVVSADIEFEDEGMTEGMTQKPITALDGVELTIEIRKKGMTDYPDILDKLTSPVWRGKLEKICHAFTRRSDMEACWLGDTNLTTVCDWLECTA